MGTSHSQSTIAERVLKTENLYLTQLPQVPLVNQISGYLYQRLLALNWLHHDAQRPGKIKCKNYKEVTIGAGEMAQWLRTLVVLPEDLSLILSTHMQLTTVCNSSSKVSDTFIATHKVK